MKVLPLINKPDLPIFGKLVPNNGG